MQDSETAVEFKPLLRSGSRPGSSPSSRCKPQVSRRIGWPQYLTSEVLDVIPAILRVLSIIRPKYACRAQKAQCTGEDVPRVIENRARILVPSFSQRGSMRLIKLEERSRSGLPCAA
jgi:hypothetical protein